MILAALNNYFDRLTEQGNDDIAPYGFSQENISYALVINTDGELVDIISLMDTSGKKPRPSVHQVPQPPKKSVNIVPNFLWDKTAYVLGLTTKTSAKEIDRARKTHEAFKQYHHEWLDDSDDEGLKALLAFLDHWNPDDKACSGRLTEEMLDTNMVFRLDGERRFIHERPAAKAIRARQLSASVGSNQVCLITGELSPVATLHPSIKGVKDAQSSGASLVSFNLDSSESFGKKQGMNAPVSDKAAFAYGTALNYLLRRDSSNHQRVQIGDMTIVFWAEADLRQQAEASERLLSSLFSSAPVIDDNDAGEISDKAETGKLESALTQLVMGRPLQEIGQDLNPDTRMYILGLAPNAARLSVRFWETDTLEHFSVRLAQHYQDMLLNPVPWRTEPSIWRLINETVPHRKGARPKQDDASPHLAGEFTRAILTGQRYPQSLLANLIMRFRADGDISNLRVALCKAVLVRNARLKNQVTYEHYDKELYVSLDTENKDPGYILGRLFFSLESAQRAALGKGVNATIRDRFYGSASATPASVFPVLLCNAQNHISKVRKIKPGLAVTLEKQIAEVIDKLESSFPRSLGLEEQGRFAIGYYHKRSELFKKHEEDIEAPASDEHTTEGDE